MGLSISLLQKFPYIPNFGKKEVSSNAFFKVKFQGHVFLCKCTGSITKRAVNDKSAFE